MRILQVHFDENQFEQHRQDGRKLLRPFATPNLLLKRVVDTNTIHKSKHEVFSHVEDLECSKYDRIQKHIEIRI